VIQGITKNAKKAVNLLLSAFGVEIKRIYKSGVPTQSLPTCIARLRHAKSLGFFPKVIFDGGAFEGNWSVSVAQIFPESQIVLMEPNPFIQDRLKNNIEKIHPKPILLNIALGEMPKESLFNIWGDVSSAASASLLDHVATVAKTRVQVAVDTLDNVSERLELEPDLIKLDLQGAEVLALKGGNKVLKKAEFAIIEFGCLEAYINRANPRHLLLI